MQEGQLLVQRGAAGQRARLAGYTPKAVPSLLSQENRGILVFQPHQDARITSAIAVDKNACRALDASSFRKGKTTHAIISITCSP